MPRLKTEKVKRIKADLCKPSATQPQVAKKHRVSRSAISDIATGRTHKNVPWPEGGPPRKRAGGQRKPVGDYDPTNARILELEADIAHLTEERNRERRKAKAGAKERGLFKAMADVLADKIVAVKPLPKVRGPLSKKDKVIEEHCVMHISDGHHDQIVRPEECGGLEEYDFPISCCRAERYVDRVIQWTQQTLHPQFHFTHLWVLAYGDHTSGEIHGHAQRSYFRNQFKNVMAIGKLHALMFRDLAPHFDQVNVVYVPGNHGRRSKKKDYYGAKDNWDYLIAELARLYCADSDNIQFVTPVELFPVIRATLPDENNVVVLFGNDESANWRRFEQTIQTSVGVLEGVGRRCLHAVAFDHGTIFDPDGDAYPYSHTACQSRGFITRCAWRIDPLFFEPF